MLVDAVTGMVLAACYLRYMDALTLGDNFASPTSCAAWAVARFHISLADLDRMHRLRGVEGPAGLDLERAAHDRSES